MIALFGFKSSQITLTSDVTLLLWLHLLGPQDEDLHKEANDRIEGLERHHSNISKDLGRDGLRNRWQVMDCQPAWLF